MGRNGCVTQRFSMQVIPDTINERANDASSGMTLLPSE